MKTLSERHAAIQAEKRRLGAEDTAATNREDAARAARKDALKRDLQKLDGDERDTQEALLREYQHEALAALTPPIREWMHEDSRERVRAIAAPCASLDGEMRLYTGQGLPPLLMAYAIITVICEKDPSRLPYFASAHVYDGARTDSILELSGVALQHAIGGNVSSLRDALLRLESRIESSKGPGVPDRAAERFEIITCGGSAKAIEEKLRALKNENRVADEARLAAAQKYVIADEARIAASSSGVPTTLGEKFDAWYVRATGNPAPRI